MKYCPNLEDHVVVMTTAQGDCKSRVCLSSHLCPTDARMSCGHEVAFRTEQTVRAEETHFV